MSDGDKAVVKAEFKIIGTRDEIDDLFTDLQANGLLTSPDSLVLQYTVFDEATALLMRETLQLVLKRNRAVVKDEKKTGVTLTFKQATPKPTRRQEALEQGQHDMFEVPEHLPTERLTMEASVVSLADQIIRHLRLAENGLTAEQLAKKIGFSEEAVSKELDNLFQRDLVDPDGNVWEVVDSSEDVDD